MELYHYTNIKGLIGIIKSRSLWATDSRFLNDGQEVEYGKEIFYSEVEKLNLPSLEDGGYRIPFRAGWPSSAFVTCFCENGDLLSQWRGYGSDQGYSLCFDEDILRSSDKASTLKSVLYGVDNPKEYFKAELVMASQKTAHPGASGEAAAERMLPRLVVIKDPAFREEAEWRWLTTWYRYDAGPNVQFRESKYGPVPYLVRRFPVEALRKVIVGPSPHSSVAALGVRDLLYCSDFKEGVKIRMSSISLR